MTQARFSTNWKWVARLLAVAVVPGAIAAAADRPQWGQRYSRNMISEETGLPETFDPASGKNVRWSVPLGTESYATPVVARGKVLIGANNGDPRDPKHQGDRGVLLCLNEDDGSLCWQLVVPKLEGDIYLDWPNAGMCSPATVEGDRVYVVSNRDEVMCLDLNGMANGNDGPFQDEGRHMTPQGQSALEVGKTDADVLWLLDLRTAAGVRPHDSAHGSILLYDRYLYVNTSNGLNNKHQQVDKPDAPSLVAVDKATGRLVARDDEHFGQRIFHSTWSSPALGEVAGRPLVFFGGGDGVCYAFAAFEPSGATGAVEMLKRAWRFDCDPTGPKENVHRYIRNRRTSPSNIKSMPVFYKDRVYVTVGGDIWWGKDQAWLKCIDATRAGDVTQTGQLWSYPVNRHCCATPAIYDGLVFVGDCGRTLHCVDAETGKPYWTHELKGDIWSSALAADGKVYVGSQRGDFWVFAAGKEKKVLASIALGDPISGTPVAANGRLYVATLKRLYALEATKTP